MGFMRCFRAVFAVYFKFFLNFRIQVTISNDTIMSKIYNCEVLINEQRLHLFAKILP